MANELTPGSTSGGYLTKQNWKRRILGALYETMDALPNFEGSAEKINDSLWVRRMGRVGSTTLSSTSTGTGLSPSDPSPTRIQIQPNWIIAYAQYPDSMPWRGGDEVKASVADTVESACAKGVDYLVTTQFASGTNTYGNSGYDIEVVGLRAILQSIHTNSRQNAKAGDLMLLLGTTQIGPALAIPEINNAYQRGDGSSPLVSGRMASGLGFKFGFSTNLYSDANGTHGAAFKKPAIQYGWNKEPNGETQRFEKATKVFCDAEIGANIVFNEMLVDIRHQ